HRRADPGAPSVLLAATLLVHRDLADPPGVPLGLAERRGQECPDQLGRLVLIMFARADRDHVGVVVLSGQLRGVGVVGQRGADPDHLVGRDLLAVAGAADHHTERSRLGHDALRGGNAEDRVVVVRVVDPRAVINDVVTVRPQDRDQMVLQLEPRVIAANVNAHGRTISSCRRWPNRGAGLFSPPCGSVDAPCWAEPASAWSRPAPRGAGSTCPTSARSGLPAPRGRRWTGTMVLPGRR